MTLAFLDGRIRTQVTGLGTAVTTILQADEPTDALRVSSVEFAGDRLATASLLFGNVPLASGLEVPQRVITRETPLHLIGTQQLRATASNTNVSAIVSYVRLPGQVKVLELPVSLLLNFSGANGGTTFVDSSPNNYTVTATGEAITSTAQSKFGGSSLRTGETQGSSLLLPQTAHFGDFGLGDFTVEWWEYIEDEGFFEGYFPIIHYGAIGDTSNFTNVWGIRYEESGNKLRFGYLGQNADFFDAPAVTDEWRHMAVVRRDGILRLFANGVVSGDDYDLSEASFPQGTGQSIVGSAFFGSGDGVQYSGLGYIDDLRITRAALYTENFTPPTSELGLS